MSIICYKCDTKLSDQEWIYFNVAPDYLYSGYMFRNENWPVGQSYCFSCLGVEPIRVIKHWDELNDEEIQVALFTFNSNKKDNIDLLTTDIYSFVIFRVNDILVDFRICKELSILD